MSKKQSFHKMVEKQICAVYDDAYAKIKKILKDNDAVIMYNCWNKPTDSFFAGYKDKVDEYLAAHTENDVSGIVIGSTKFATHAEIEEFKTKTWPKLFAKWKKTEIEPEKKNIREQIKILQNKLAELDKLK